MTGGFATGRLLAGGALLDFEREMASRLGFEIQGDDRRDLNAWHLTEEGLTQLQELLKSGLYQIDYPEEGALLTIAWLTGAGHADEARALTEIIAPHFARLRFYPKPSLKMIEPSTNVHVLDVGTTIWRLGLISPNLRILAQKEAAEVWSPLYERIVAMFLETVEDDWPCQRYADDWPLRAKALLFEYSELRKSHPYCGKMERPREHCCQLRMYLARCSTDPVSLTGRDVARIREILGRYVVKHGAPGSPDSEDAKSRRTQCVRKPLWHRIARILIDRLAAFPVNEGIEEAQLPFAPVTPAESERNGVAAGTTIPMPIQRKVLRSLHAPVDRLIELGIVKSAETLATCLPQFTSNIRAMGLTDSKARSLYAAIDRAFRRRRSLLLLNLEKQVQIQELPWIASIEKFRIADSEARNVAFETLREVSLMAISNFPYAIVPNKLIQEFEALARSAGLKMPFVNEVAADIFMGEFSPKYLDSAHMAAELLENSLYSTYYSIDYAMIRKIPKATTPPKETYFRFRYEVVPDQFAELCRTRAGTDSKQWSPAVNGMIIEQQQILTTQNLAQLCLRLDLLDVIHDSLPDMARRCFDWIILQQKPKFVDWHTELKLIKNSAYAWRQMVFFLSLMQQEKVAAFLDWADQRLADENPDFGHRFMPAMRGLRLANQGVRFEDAPQSFGEVRRFIGWTTVRHWLMRDAKR